LVETVFLHGATKGTGEVFDDTEDLSNQQLKKEGQKRKKKIDITETDSELEKVIKTLHKTLAQVQPGAIIDSIQFISQAIQHKKKELKGCTFFGELRRKCVT